MDLAKPGDPLVDRQGKLIEAEGRREPDYSLNVPIARLLSTKNPRSVREISSDPQTQTVINAVLVYKILGVGRNEVAHVLNTTITEIDTIERMPGFQDTFELLFKELLSSSSNSIQARIQSYAGRALDNLMDLADAKPVLVKDEDALGNEIIRREYDVAPMVILKANDSLLDRAGLNADNLYAKDNQQEAHQLEIEITTADSNKTNVKINTGGKR